MKKSVVLIVVFLLIVIVSFASAANYYVDLTDSGSSNLGTYAEPFKTIATVNSHSFNTGDDLYFKQGVTHLFDTQLNIDWSGTSSDHVTIGCYEGNGDFTCSGARPILRGTQIDYFQTSSPYVDTAGVPNSGYHGLVESYYQSFVEIAYLEVTQSNWDGIRSYGNDHTSIHDCNVHDNNAGNIYINHENLPANELSGSNNCGGEICTRGPIGGRKYTEIYNNVNHNGCELKNHYSNYNQAADIDYYASRHGWIHNNEIYSTQCEAIGVYFGSNRGDSTIEYNYVHGYVKYAFYNANSGYNIWRGNLYEGEGNPTQVCMAVASETGSFASQNKNVRFIGNICNGANRGAYFNSYYSSGDPWDNIEIVGNTMFNNYYNVMFSGSGICTSLSQGSGNIFKDNIIQNGADTVSQVSLGCTPSAMDFDYNLWEQNPASALQGLHDAPDGNDGFTDESSGDLTIRSSSNAIDRGIDLYDNLAPSSVWPDSVYTTSAVNARDIGAFEYVSVSGCTQDSQCSDLDDLPCIEGYCDSGTCRTRYTSNQCDDGVACTENDVCSSGVCSGTANNALCTGRPDCDTTTCTSSGCQYSGCPIPELCDSLTLLMHFDGNASDESGNNNNGAVSGASLVGGKFDQAYSFDGINDYISTSNIDFSGTNKITACFWLRPNKVSSTQIFAELSDNYNLQTNSFIIYVRNTDKIESSLKGDLSYSSWDTSTNITTGNWYHICGIFDKSLSSGESRAYINGFQDGSFVYDNDNTNNFGNRPLYIGSRAGASVFTSGVIDDLGIWSRALNSREISDLYNSNAPITCTTVSICGHADSDGNSVVSISELISYISRWKAGSVTIGDLIDAIGKWKSEC